MTASHGPLEGIRVLDLSRILASPTRTQLLGIEGEKLNRLREDAII